MLRSDKTIIDSRTIILLLLSCNVVTFTQQNFYIELGMWLFLAIIMIVSGCAKQLIKWAAILIGIVVLETYILPCISFSFASGFFIMLSFGRKIMPCLMIGSIVINKIPSQYLILAFRKFHVPNVILIPFAVTIRYIPSLKMEYSNIKDAMKLRNIPKMKQVESVIVSLVMSAAKTADELSAAAVTRGIENPCHKTSVFEMKLTALDITILTVSTLLMALSICSRGGTL